MKAVAVAESARSVFRRSITFQQTNIAMEHRPSRGVLKWGYPQIIHVHWIFHYKPSMLG